MASSATTSTSRSSPVVVTAFPVNPLTTTFTPPADCSGLYVSTVAMVDPSLSCLPSGASTQATDYFSPGIACPSGYYTACHDTDGVASITTVTCCPFRGDVTLSCVHPTTLTDVFATLFCTWIAPSVTTLAVTLSRNGGTTSTEELQFESPGGLNAYGIRMVYESTDIITSSASSIISASTTRRKISSTSLPAKSTSPASTKSTSPGTVAIAVVIPVVVLAVLGAIVMWWRRRRRQQRNGGAEPKGRPPGDPTEFSNSLHTTPAELPMEGVSRPVETTSQSHPHPRGELPGGPVKLSSYAYTRLAELPAEGTG